MPIVMIIIGTFFGSLFCVALLAFVIKRKKGWSHALKKRLFIGLSTFLVCPILVPVAITAIFPVPNIAFLALAIAIGDHASILPLYAKNWVFILPTAAMTALLMWGISNMVFYKNKNAQQSD